MRRPATVTVPSGRTRAPGYHAGPLTTFAASAIGRGEAATTRWRPSAPVLEPTTQLRHDRAQPPIPPAPTTSRRQPDPCRGGDEVVVRRSSAAGAAAGARTEPEGSGDEAQ